MKIKSLKACLLLLCVLFNGNAALALDENKADIRFEKYDKNINVTVNGSGGNGGGCSSGQYWDIGVGGCTSAVALKTLSTSQGCPCSCPGGMTGSCSASQSGTYTVFGWRVPTNGAELISHNGPTSWGSCSETSNSCVAAPTPPSGGGGGGGGGGPASIGTTYSVTAMICGLSDPTYSTPPANTPTVIRDMIISEYRKWLGGRCPEASGFINWVSYVNARAYEDWGGNPGVPDLNTYITAYTVKTLPAILVAADQNGERTILGMIAADTHCQRAATEKYGPTVKAEYVMNTGNQCIVTAL